MLAGRHVVYSDDGRNILEDRSERRYLRGWGSGLWEVIGGNPMRDNRTESKVEGIGSRERGVMDTVTF